MSAESGDPTARRASSAHTYRLLIFKDRVRIHYQTRTGHLNFNHPVPLRSASLHQQQRNEIMKNLFRLVNNFFSLSLKTLLTLRPLVSAAALVRKRGGEY
ncbi:hypothetical protein [Paraburkholderia fungorum]|uniref:hypothetical protein n=1 Tax=Paraburkholderia fungorum TaxID=134537 RepID=UPI0038BA8C44